MSKKIRFFILFLLIAGCIEPYEFVVRDNAPALVIEAFISDRSYNQTLLYPSDGRYFTVKLANTGDVTNTRATPVRNAVVELLTTEGEVLNYTETNGGLYALVNNDFQAKQGVGYRLRVSVQDADVYVSSWERMPDTEIPAMGDIGFKETVREYYVMESSEWVLRKKQTVSATIDVPENHSGEAILYRWTYSPTWIYVAPLISMTDPVYKCWAIDPYYLNTYALQSDKTGGYQKDLFYFPTVRNERIFEKLSVLVTQHAMTPAYFAFWKEMKDQNEGSALTDTPPYNLKTNFTSSTGKKVSGYFGVGAEQARRWYFDRTLLSYNVPKTLLGDCQVVYGPGPPAEECTDCRAYSFGKATTTRPSWWQD
jgi:hypothetical protein